MVKPPVINKTNIVETISDKYILSKTKLTIWKKTNNKNKNIYFCSLCVESKLRYSTSSRAS
jgi:hypothetical protein